MMTIHRRPRKPTSAAVVALIVTLLFSQQTQAQLPLLDPVTSTTEMALSTLGPLTNPLLGLDTVSTELVGKLSGDLQVLLGGPADQPLRVIVQTYAAPDSGELTLLQLLGGVLRTVHSIISGYSATVRLGTLLQLAADPNVERISLDSPVKAHLDVAYRAIRADQAAALSGGWGSGLTGKGIGIALVDTGVQLHQDFRRPIGSKPIVEVEIVGHELGIADYFGHGTHVAGILYGNGSASSDSLSFRTFKGIAPEAQLISVRALAPDGSGYTSDVIAGIEWVVRNARFYNIRVLNLSLGHPVYESYLSDPLCRVVAAAVRRGIVVVVAAGNDGTVGTGFGTITSPGNSPAAITVGALDDQNTVPATDDVLAWYSSKGPTLIDFVVKPDLVAPGTWIVSARAVSSWLDTQHHELTLQIADYKHDPAHAAQDGAYYTLSGTSMAAPMVAGAAALMLQKDPTLDPATIKARLMKSAVKDAQLVFETGAGALDVYGAVSATGSAQSASSPLAMPGSDGSVYIQDTAFLWGSSWSQGAIWGNAKGGAYGISLTPVPGSITSGSGAVWGGRAGAKSLTENPEVTGSGAVWGGARSSLTSTQGTIEGEGAIWGGGSRSPSK
jgi:serine protease AprX